MKNKTLENLISFLVILLPLILVGFVYSLLPADMPIHYGLKGQANGFLDKQVALILAPCLAVLLQGILLATLSKQGVEHKGFRFFLVWLLPISFFTIQTSLILKSLGTSLDIRRIALIAVAFIFLVIGNYLPKQVMLEQERVGSRKLAYLLWLLALSFLVLSLFL